MRGIAWGMAAFVLAPVASFGGSVEDDLAVVRKAVAQSATAPEKADSEGKAPAAARADRMRWLKVRVSEKAGKRVSINVPLSFARVLGDDWPVNVGCRKNGRSRVTLGEILRSLEAGQDIVQVDSDDATVRVWVE
jgi:hypothetical protein